MFGAVNKIVVVIGQIDKILAGKHHFLAPAKIGASKGNDRTRQPKTEPSRYLTWFYKQYTAPGFREHSVRGLGRL